MGEGEGEGKFGDVYAVAGECRLDGQASNGVGSKLVKLLTQSVWTHPRSHQEYVCVIIIAP